MREFPNLIVVLVEPETPGNVGFTSRVLANFGVSRLRIVGVDPRYDEEAQIFAVHANNILESAEIYDTLDAALEDVHIAWAATARIGKNHNVTRAAVPLPDIPDPKSLDADVALVFGRESNGLTNDEVSLCDLIFTIPTSDEYGSLNLSHAVAVTLYHLFNHYAEQDPPKPTEATPATRHQREIVNEFFEKAIDCLDMHDYRKPIAKQVFRNLLGRAYMTGREVATMTGFIRKFMDLACKEGQDS